MSYKDQLEILEADVNRLPDDIPTKGVWRSLFHVLTSWNDVVDELTEMKGQIKVIQSDVRVTKNLVSNLGSGEIQFDKNNHPARRESDQEELEVGEADKWVRFFKKEIWPGLVRRFIDTVIIILVVLAVLHWPELTGKLP